ncbi:MAG: hypothetical protein LBI13_05550 [Streptococcaceae bacterium]|jgi:hypothetical protein|nr:hypothetical protein [Streptococcaceae bacterium]
MVMTLEQAMATFEDNNTSNDKKMGLLTFIGHHYEYLRGKEHEEEAIRVADKLISYLINEKDEWVRDEILSALLFIVGGYLPIGYRVNYNPILNNIDDFSTDELSDILGLLGWSQNQEYRAIIEKYRDIPELSEDVKDALSDLDYGVK